MADLKRLGNIALLLTVVMTTCRGQTIEDTQTLMTTLLTGYDRDVRPVEDQSRPVVVNITFDLVAIQGFDEISETLTTIGVMNLEWFDPRMTWNPASYNNTYTIDIRIKNVWIPYFILSSSMESIRAMGHQQEWMNVHYVHNGQAYWSPGDLFKSACSVDVTYFPFDVQTCDMKFLPWGLTTSQILPQSKRPEVLLSYFTENGEWIYSGSKISTNDQANSFAHYTVEITITRRATYFLVNVIQPMLFMTVLNVLVFWLPPESGERVSYAITVLLAISVFLTVVGDNIPKTSKTMSMLCYFLIGNLFLSALVCAIAIFNLNFYFKHSGLPLPKWLESMTRCVNCNKGTNGTHIEKLAEEQLDDVIPTSKDDQKVVDRWAYSVGDETGSVSESRDNKPITWREVSCAIDKVFGVVTIIWLIVSTSTFIGMVATHTKK